MSSASAAVSDPGAAPPIPAAGIGRRPASRASWALTALIGGIPIWWALGLGSLIWIIAAVPMGVRLLRRWPNRAPRGFGIWLMFVIWMMLSVSQVSGTRYLSFGYRALLYLAATVMFLYVYNLTEEELPRAKILKLAVVYFLWGAIGGYLGLILGETGFTSVMEMILPRSITANEFAATMVHPTFAQTQDFLGFALPRPTAPFVFTNEWGSGMSLLFPFVMAAIAGLDRRWQAWATLALTASLVPIVLSVNRGLWLNIGIAFAYGAVLLAMRGNPAYLRSLAAGAVLVALVVALPPMNSVVAGRFESDHSNNARLTLYGQVIDQVPQSPLFGFGAPVANEENPNLPAVGTHGQLWTVLFSHGIPGALLFVAFAVSLAWRTTVYRDPVSTWLHVVVALVPLLMWFYELLAPPLFIWMLAGAAALRGPPKRTPEGPSPVSL